MPPVASRKESAMRRKRARQKRRIVAVIGLGGIYEGYGPQLPLLATSGILPLQELWLIDGDRFEKKNSLRQNIGEEVSAPKAVVRRNQLLALSPRVPIGAIPEYVSPKNVRDLIPENAVVLLSPDNHPTRYLVSRHCQTLDNVRLIVGGNSGMNDPDGRAGEVVLVQVHCRKGGRNVTAPVEVYHPEIRESREQPRWDPSCAEVISTGETQVLQTNLLVGSWMLQMLLRYLTTPWKEATEMAELALHAGKGCVVPYARPPQVRQVTRSKRRRLPCSRS
jgi:hypothetical protein